MQIKPSRATPIFLQLLLILLLAFSFWLFFGANWFASSILGGLVCIVPNYIFGKIFLSKPEARKPAKEILNKFYLAELAKVGITIILFVLFLKFLTINPLAFFVSFVIVQALSWILNFLNVKREQHKH